MTPVSAVAELVSYEIFVESSWQYLCFAMRKSLMQHFVQPASLGVTQKCWSIQVVEGQVVSSERLSLEEV